MPTNEKFLHFNSDDDDNTHEEYEEIRPRRVGIKEIITAEEAEKYKGPIEELVGAVLLKMNESLRRYEEENEVVVQRLRSNYTQDFKTGEWMVTLQGKSIPAKYAPYINLDNMDPLTIDFKIE